MSEKPILFSTQMVQAIIEGRKTQTRRPVTRLRGFGLLDDFSASERVDYPWRVLERPKNDGRDWFVTNESVLDRLPYQVGDILWVRETWARCQPLLEIKSNDGRIVEEFGDGYAEFKADGYESIDDLKSHYRLCHGGRLFVDGDRWRPSIHMPRWAARLFLGVTEVRLQPLQSITKNDAMAEGVDLDSFIPLWDDLYSKRGYGWIKNPTVAVYEFRRTTK